MKVDVIEAVFLIIKSDFEAVNKISQISKNSIICGLARAHSDIDCAGNARQKLKKKIHTFISTGDLHMKFKLR